METIKTHIQYWIDYKGDGDEYRRTHDLDCILTDGNLFADTLFSLWLPLRYVLNYCGTERIFSSLSHLFTVVSLIFTPSSSKTILV